MALLSVADLNMLWLFFYAITTIVFVFQVSVSQRLFWAVIRPATEPVPESIFVLAM